MAHPDAGLAMRFRLSFVGAALLMLAACTSVRLISDYDEVTDQKLMSIQQKTDDFIVALSKVTQSADGAFARHAAFYDDIDRDLRQLEFRVQSIPNNTKTQALVADIRKAVLGDGSCSADGASLRDLHCIPENRERGPSPRALEIARRNVNQAISAALSLELAKKQGSEVNQ